MGGWAKTHKVYNLRAIGYTPAKPKLNPNIGFTKVEFT
jgi:hypothetical protein